LTEDGYQQSILLGAARERVWDAVGTAAGPRQWWTTNVTGSAGEGGELRFGFAGLPEEMTMLVVSSRRPASVSWRCTAHNRNQEWTGTELSFELTDRGPGRCELTFRHTGLPGDVVAGGWRHFLASLTAYAEGGTGHPFGADRDSGR
jgi:uncharacterized protein YndB with AHSA1/START domain